jgi:hypothetical protein
MAANALKGLNGSDNRLWVLTHPLQVTMWTVVTEAAYMESHIDQAHSRMFRFYAGLLAVLKKNHPDFEDFCSWREVQSTMAEDIHACRKLEIVWAKCFTEDALKELVECHDTHEKEEKFMLFSRMETMKHSVNKQDVVKSLERVGYSKEQIAKFVDDVWGPQEEEAADAADACL